MSALPPFGKHVRELAAHCELWIYHGGPWNDARVKIASGTPAVMWPDGEPFTAFDWSVAAGRDVFIVHRTDEPAPLDFPPHLRAAGAGVIRMADRANNFWVFR